jgi:hypothetical protein
MHRGGHYTVTWLLPSDHVIAPRCQSLLNLYSEEQHAEQYASLTTDNVRGQRPSFRTRRLIYSTPSGWKGSYRTDGQS